jgi:Mn2+/Fe2+ NRAMP family transporter
MTPLFSLDYWFNTRPELLSRSAVLALVLVGLACAYLIYLAKNKQKNKDYSKSLWYRLENFAISNLALSWIMALCSHHPTPPTSNS